LLAAGGECALTGVLDGCEFLSGERFEYLQVDEVPVAWVLPAWPQRRLGNRVQLLGDLPAYGEYRDDLGAVQADRAEVVCRDLFDLVASTGAISTTIVMKGFVRNATLMRTLWTCGRSSSGAGSLRSKENSS
jgi:hypothetical protein